MSNPQSQRFRIGLFVLGTLGVAAFLTTLFGGFPDLFRKYDTYTVRFRDAQGIGPGTPVRRSGIRIGEVEKVHLDDATGMVLVHLKIERNRPVFEDDLVEIPPSVIGGDSFIDFQRPNQSAARSATPDKGTLPEKPAVPFADRPMPPPPDPVPPPPDGEEASQEKVEPPVRAKPGFEFQGVRQPDVGNVLKSMSELVEPTQESLRLIRQSLQRLEKTAPLAEDTLREYRDLARDTRKGIPELMRTNDEINVTARNWGKLGERLDVLIQTNQDKLVKAVDNLNETLTRVGSTFNDENQRNLAALLKNARAGSENLESIAKNTDELMKEGRSSLKRLNDSLTKADVLLDDMQKAVKPLAERSDSISRNLDEGAAKLNKTLTDVRDLLKVFEQGDGTLQKLLTDPAIYNRLEDILCFVNKMMPRVDRTLKDLEVFADKLARHPESIGLGGAIRPSAGLKEAPSPTNPYGPRR